MHIGFEQVKFLFKTTTSSDKDSAIIGGLLLVLAAVLALASMFYYLYTTNFLRKQQENNLLTAGQVESTKVDPINPKVVNFNGMKWLNNKKLDKNEMVI